MKQFRCGDVVLGCEWVARNDDEQVLHGKGLAEVGQDPAHGAIVLPRRGD